MPSNVFILIGDDADLKKRIKEHEEQTDDERINRRLKF
jgi:hypothetical protein